MIISLVAGARPNFMKIAPIIRAIRQAAAQGFAIEYKLIHTGQHYDHNMSGQFFEQLEIPKPDVNLECGGGTQAEQTANIMVRFEKYLSSNPCDLVMVVGDVTSTMACAIVAQKLKIKVAHVEGGIRSGDWNMPEEINRIVTDSITNYFFTTSETANTNLYQQGVPADSVFFVGNTMIDTLLFNQDRLIQPKAWENYQLSANEFMVLTLHRPSNVDEEYKLGRLLKEIVINSRELPILFPVHPRTAKTLSALNIPRVNLHFIKPLGYLEFIYLIKHAKAIITDSGGITEEATVLGVPCMTLRDSTERPETITLGTNELLGTDPKSIKPAFDRLFNGQWKKGAIPENWDGQSAKRIINILIQEFKVEKTEARVAL